MTLHDPAYSLVGRRLDRYEVLCLLATGGMAAVYAARSIGVAGFERLVAIKVLHPHLAHEEEFISMFLDEARLAARIRHPNVVGTLDVSDSKGDGFFIVMEYVEGHHLGALLQQAAKTETLLPTSVVLRIVLDALAGLEAAHTLTDEAGIPLELVHRDISPHNIMVGTDGVARLTDFGIARAEVRLATTREGQLKGKLGYMAPEQAGGNRADQRSDLFAMAIVLWEALTGRRLFRAETNAATLDRILHGAIPLPSEFQSSLAPLDAIFRRALARDPEERFPTARAFAEALEQQAVHVGGLCPARNVADAVRELAKEKVERDRRRIQGALTDPPPRPDRRDRTSEPSSSGLSPSGLGVSVGSGESTTVASALPLATAVFGMGAIALGAWLVWDQGRGSRNDDSGSTEQTAPPTPQKNSPAPQTGPPNISIIAEATGAVDGGTSIVIVQSTPDPADAIRVVGEDGGARRDAGRLRRTEPDGVLSNPYRR